MGDDALLTVEQARIELGAAYATIKRIADTLAPAGTREYCGRTVRLYRLADLRAGYQKRLEAAKGKRLGYGAFNPRMRAKGV